MKLIIFLILFSLHVLGAAGCEGSNCEKCGILIEFELPPQTNDGEDCYYGDILKEDLKENPDLEQVSCIHGDLYITSSSLINLSFASLETVEGDIFIHNNSSLESLAFPKLQQIEGDLSIIGNPELASLAGLEHLQSVEGAIYFLCNSTLANCEIEALLSPLRRQDPAFAACYDYNQQGTGSGDRSGCPDDIARQCDYR